MTHDASPKRPHTETFECWIQPRRDVQSDISTPLSTADSVWTGALAERIEAMLSLRRVEWCPDVRSLMSIARAVVRLNAMKTLLVHYTPTGESSRSRALLDAFRQEMHDSEVQELDLCTDVPDLFTPERMQAFIARYVLRTVARDTPLPLLSKMDRMTAQLRWADIVVLTFPMHNFSTPAPVKAWFDSVIRGGETFDRRDSNYIGLMTGKRAVVLVASGGTYRTGTGVGPWFGPSWEHALKLAEFEFQFMGFSDISAVLAEGQVIGDPERSARFLEEALAQVRTIARELYGATWLRNGSTQPQFAVPTGTDESTPR